MTKNSLLPATTLPQTLYRAIIAHARAGKPEEICGILRGRGLQATALYRARNIAGDKIDNYEVDPQSLLLQFDFEDAGDEMMGIYHSHPISVAYPSATDAWNAHYPDSLYFICSLEDDAAPVLRAFRLTPHYLTLDAAALADVLPFTEVRPGLFGAYLAEDAALPQPLVEAAGAFEEPFYVVFQRDSTGPDAPEVRLVTVREHPIHITDSAA